MPNTPAATESDAQAFCELCQWVYECWLTHSHFFERLPVRLEEESNVPIEKFLETPSGRCLHHLNEISQQYSLLQIAKLHDPARQGGNENLSIDFFVKQASWSEAEVATIAGITSELDSFYKKIKDARNNILAHNDRSVFTKDVPLGGFMEGEDEKYFGALGQLCSMIWKKFPNKNLPYDARVFDFKKSGNCGVPLCPSNDAKELADLIVGAYSKDSRRR